MMPLGSNGLVVATQPRCDQSVSAGQQQDALDDLRNDARRFR